MTKALTTQTARRVRRVLEPVLSPEQQLIAMAKDPTFDVEKLRMLMDMNKEVKDDQKRAEFAAAFVEMKPHLPKVLKLHSNTQTKSKYAKLEDINSQIDPILEQYGFATATKVTNQNDQSVTVEAELWHKNGHVERTSVTMPLDTKGPGGTVNKTGPHATSSSITYAKRVSICALLNISTGDDKDGNRDKGDGKDVQYISDDQIEALELYIHQTETDKAKFLLAYNANLISELTVQQYEDGLLKLKRKAGEVPPNPQTKK